ncbi:hypothetical protein ACJX0J_030662, partial [Zea mays]
VIYGVVLLHVHLLGYHKSLFNLINKEGMRQDFVASPLLLNLFSWAQYND